MTACCPGLRVQNDSDRAWQLDPLRTRNRRSAFRSYRSAFQRGAQSGRVALKRQRRAVNGDYQSWPEHTVQTVVAPTKSDQSYGSTRTREPVSGASTMLPLPM
jgi:hypothetical protein